MTKLVNLVMALVLIGCGDDGASTVDPGDAQTPPIGRVAVEAWLTAGASSYKTWASEPTVHASRDPSPHGFNRIYSNALIADNAAGTAAWPEGAASVKELYADQASTTPIGVAVYLKLAADSGGGANWYWYERVPLDSEAPHDTNGVVADGDGGSGPAKDICVGCHTGAGTDPAHTPTPGGRDQVYTPVR